MDAFVVDGGQLKVTITVPDLYFHGEHYSQRRKGHPRIKSYSQQIFFFLLKHI